MIFTVELKRHMASVGIFSIIIDKLCYKKKLYSIILLKIDKDLEIGLYFTILSFGLIVYLWVKSNRESLLDLEEIA